MTPLAVRTSDAARLELVPITLRAANDFVERHHRHSRRTSRDGGKWATAVACDGRIVGVAIVGRPLARLLDDGWTAEVLRVCVEPDAPRNVCSMLYSSCWRCWRAMGGKRMVTYTLVHELGTSLKASGWAKVAECRAHQWHGGERVREQREIYRIDKARWEVGEKCGDPVPVADKAPDAQYVMEALQK